MNLAIWAIAVAVLWSNTEILLLHKQNGTKPSPNFWISITFAIIALIIWIIE